MEVRGGGGVLLRQVVLGTAWGRGRLLGGGGPWVPRSREGGGARLGDTHALESRSGPAQGLQVRWEGCESASPKRLVCLRWGRSQGCGPRLAFANCLQLQRVCVYRFVVLVIATMLLAAKKLYNAMFGACLQQKRAG